jgi:exosortase A-associated hydrolase 1
VADRKQVGHLFMEEPIQFSYNGKKLYGILHVSEIQGSSRDVIIMVTGGPQTRYGSHRLYIQLSRFLCEKGITVFRFDYEGMGDSEGEFVGARYSEPSIHAAIQYIDSRFPERNRKIIWALCDGATASTLYASHHKDMLAGLILCNPFIYGEAALYRKHYYKRRIFDKDFWVRFFKMKINSKEAFLEIMEYFYVAFMKALREKFGRKSIDSDHLTYEYFLSSLQQIGVPIYCILSANDDVAHEFREKILSHNSIKTLQANRHLKILSVTDADHTFTRQDTREALFSLTVGLLREAGFTVPQQDGCIPLKAAHTQSL